MSRITQLLSALFVLALAACGGGTGPYSGGTGNPPGNGTTVTATAGLAFSPNPLSVNSGQTVTFAFGAVAHNVIFDTPRAPADIPGNNSNVSIERAFTTAGTYQFHCTIHPGMAGSVVVR